MNGQNVVEGLLCPLSAVESRFDTVVGNFQIRRRSVPGPTATHQGNEAEHSGPLLIVAAHIAKTIGNVSRIRFAAVFPALLERRTLLYSHTCFVFRQKPKRGQDLLGDCIMAAPLLLTVGTAIAFYIIIGYPLLLACFFRRSAPPVRKDMGFRTTVSVLLAVHNGERFIRKKLECLLALNYPAGLMEILVVSDGSTDTTEAIVESSADRRVRLLRAPRSGKPPAKSCFIRMFVNCSLPIRLPTW
jgi:hypothetical protein